MVVWAHAEGPFSSYINQFHMPFFFFISGTLFQMPKDNKEYIKRKMKTLLIPFWKWNLLLLIPFWIFYFWKKWEIEILLQYFIEIGATVNKVPMLGATWFLPALFWTCIVFLGLNSKIEKLNINDWKKGLILLIFGGMSCGVGMYYNFPYRISRNLICSFFFILGYLYQKYIKRVEKEQIADITAYGMFVVYLMIASNNMASMGTNEYKYKILFLTGAIMASYAVLIFSRKLDSIRFARGIAVVNCLRYLGANTMPIVIWHFVFFRIAIMLQIIMKDIPLKAIVSFPIYDGKHGWWFIYVVCGISGSLIWNNFLGKIRIIQHKEKKL